MTWIVDLLVIGARAANLIANLLVGGHNEVRCFGIGGLNRVFFLC